MLPRILSRPLRPYSNYASTSKFTLETPLPSYERLTQRSIPTTPIPSGPKAKRNSPAFYAQLKSTRVQEAVEEPYFIESTTRPYSLSLSLITRERNYLIGSLRHALDSPNADPDQVWKRLVAILNYPSILPQLRYSRPSLVRENKVDGLENGEEVQDERRGIVISLRELRKCFTIIGGVRPPTRGSLNKLLVLNTLLVMRSGVKSEFSGAGGISDRKRDDEILKLEGGGVGLRPFDWHTLISFSARSYRNIRPVPEISSAVGIFSQWSKLNYRPNGRLQRPGIETYNDLLKIALDAGNWILFDAIKDRMKVERVRDDFWSLRIKLSAAEKRDHSMEIIWSSILEINELILNSELQFETVSGGISPKIGLWNEIIWIFCKRGLDEEVMKIYEALGNTETKEINLHSLSPNSIESTHLEPMMITLPSRNIIAETALIQHFTHQGDFIKSISILRDLLESDSPPNFHVFTCFFKAFATHSTSTVSPNLTLNQLTLSGKKSTANKITTKSFTNLAIPLLSNSNEENTAYWSLQNLESLLPTFFALKPNKLEKFRNGGRNAPTPKQIFWLLLALEKLSNDNEMILKIWEKVRETFGEKKVGWIGWRSDLRLERKMKEFRLRLALEKEREEGLS